MKQLSDLDKVVCDKQMRLQTRTISDDDKFHENEIRRAMKQAGMDDKTILQIINNLHSFK